MPFQEIFSDFSFSSYFPVVSFHKMIAANTFIFVDLILALILGLIFGYERSYHGRAAGMRTYGLVCMVAAALTVVSGHADLWFSGHAVNLGPIDPTRTIQGIVTGIGFLGAGIIMKDGLNISGLTTAASIWSASAIGILVGLGFYAAAVFLTFLSAGFVMWGPKIAEYLPSRQAVFVSLQFKALFVPNDEKIRSIFLENGYEIARGSIAVAAQEGKAEWRFVVLSLSGAATTSITNLGQILSAVEGVEGFQLARARN